MKVHKVSTITKALFLAGMLTGCSMTPDYTAPEMTMSEAYTQIEGVNGSQTLSSDQAWWKGFNDPILNQLVADAQQQNIPLRIASERIKMAQSYHEMVSSFKVPTVSLGAGYVNYQISENDPLLGAAVSPIGVPAAAQPLVGSSVTLMDQQQDGFGVGATIAWEMDLFGRIDSQADAAEIRKEQVEIYRSGLNTLVTADVISNYLQYRGAIERKAIAMGTIEDQKSTLKLVKKVVDNGYGSELDISQASAMLAATEAIIPQLDIAANIHKQRLAILLGQRTSSLDLGEENSEQVTPELTGIIPLGLPSDLLQRRPDVRMAEREIAATNEELGAAIASRYPKLFLTGTPGLVAGDFDDLFNSGSFSWMASAGVSWTVFDGGRGEAMVDIQEARLETSVLTYQHAVNGAFAEVETLLFAYGNSKKYQASITEALQQTETALSKANALYNAGLIDYLSVLDAQRQHNMMKDRVVAAKLQTAQSVVGLHKALGGEWEI